MTRSARLSFASGVEVAGQEQVLRL